MACSNTKTIPTFNIDIIHLKSNIFVQCEGLFHNPTTLTELGALIWNLGSNPESNEHGDQSRHFHILYADHQYQHGHQNHDHHEHPFVEIEIILMNDET